LQNLANLLQQKHIRSVYDKTSSKWWFSVVDVCAAIRDCDYKTAKEYWKWLKRKWIAEGNQLGSVTHQLKFPAADGKYYYTAAMDIKDVLRLIQAFPSPKAEPFRLWLADIISKDASVTEQFAEVGAKNYEKSKQEVESGTNSYKEFIKTTTITEIPL